MLTQFVGLQTLKYGVGGGRHRQHGIYFVNSTNFEFHVRALEKVNVGVKTTYEEQDLTPD